MFKLLTKLTGLKLAEFESEDEKQDNVMPSSSSELDDSELKSCCAFEVRHWSHGSYTLVHDTDPGLHEYALDAMLFFGCDGKILSIFKHYFLQGTFHIRKFE